MAKKTTAGEKQGATSGTVTVLVQIPTPCKIKLQTLDDIRVEKSRVYRECRAGKLDVTEGGKLSYQLQGIGKMIEASVIEKRLTALESGIRMQDEIDDVEFKEVA